MPISNDRLEEMDEFVNGYVTTMHKGREMVAELLAEREQLIEAVRAKDQMLDLQEYRHGEEMKDYLAIRRMIGLLTSSKHEDISGIISSMLFEYSRCWERLTEDYQVNMGEIDEHLQAFRHYTKHSYSEE